MNIKKPKNEKQKFFFWEGKKKKKENCFGENVQKPMMQPFIIIFFLRKLSQLAGFI